MTEETQQVAAEEDSIEKITKDFPIEETATQFRPQAQTIVEQPRQESKEPVPDPFDTDAHKAYMQRIAEKGNALESTLTQAMTKISAYEQKASREALEADIDKAVTEVNEIVQHPNKKMVEVALELEARDDPKFKAIWDNRAKNPQALSRALKVKANQLAESFSMKVDPKLVASQRALKNSQSQTATTTTKDPEGHPLENLSDPDEFARTWNRMVSGGY